MTSGQEKVRLDMAIRIFCHEADNDSSHKRRCGEYLRMRCRAAAEKLLQDGDLAGLKVCMNSGFFSPKEREQLLLLAVKKGQTDCLSALLSSDGGNKAAEEAVHQETPLYMRILMLQGRKFDRNYPFLGQILHLLLPAGVTSQTTYMGTDGFSLCLCENALLKAFSKDSEQCQRDMAHVLGHQLLFHPLYAVKIKEHRWWDICCDVMTEWMLEKRLGYLRTADNTMRRSRTEVYQFLEKEKIASAADLYPRLQHISEEHLQALQSLFFCDDHTLWYTSEHTPEEWCRQVRRQRRAAGEGSEEGVYGGIRGSGGHTVKKYQEPEASEYDYQAFLETFMVSGEERILDQDDFDPILYHYSRCHYDGPVFLEPLETSEVRRLSELVIAIDTSGSCSGDIVQQFLRETFSILEKKERFFRKMRVHILQCDSMIQDYQLIQNEQEWEDYRENVKIVGFGNTDFRPVFDWIDKKQKSGDIRDLKGLIYFTDGAGIFPREAPEYEVAFVHLNEQLLKGNLPSFIRPVNLHMEREFANLFDEESSFGYCGGK